MKNYNVSKINDLLRTAKTALIVVPQISVDSVGSALALAIALKKKNISAKVYSPQKTDNNYSKLSGLDLLINAFSSSDLVVSLEYPLDQIEQVSYNDDGGRLNLVVKTKAGSSKIENDKIIVNNQSSAADICFMLGDETLLGQNSSMVDRGSWVFVSPINIPKNWAKASLIDPDAPFSEIFTFLLPMLGLDLDQDSGKNLLIGLRVATQSFSVNVSPETFEAGAVCLRATQPVVENNNPNSYNSQTPIESVESKPNQFQSNQPSSVPTA